MYYFHLDGDATFSTFTKEMKNTIAKACDSYGITNNPDNTVTVDFSLSGSHNEDDELRIVLEDFGDNLCECHISYTGEEGECTRETYNTEDGMWEEEEEVCFFMSDFKTKEEFITYVDGLVNDFFG